MKGASLARSGSISLIGSVFAALAALVLTILVGNGFGTYGTGVFFQAVGIFTIVSHILRLGTNSSIVRAISEQRAFDRSGELWRTVVIGIVPVLAISVVVALLATRFATELAGWLTSASERDNLADLIVAMAPFLSVGAVLAVVSTVNRMVNGVTTFTVIQSVLIPASRLVAVGVAVVLVWDASDAFRAWVGILPVWLILSIVVVARPLYRDWKSRRRAQEPGGQAARRFWAFSGSRAVGGAFEIGLEWSDVLIVAAFASPAEAGVYAVATRTVRVGQIVDRAMRVAVSPTIAQQLARGELGAARALHTSVTRAMILASWPYYLLLATMGPAVLVLFGPGFAEGSLVLIVLASSMLIASAAGMLQSILLQGGRSSWQMVNKGIALAVSIGLNVLLVPSLGLAGAALTWAVVTLIDTAIAGWQVHRRMGVRLEPRKLLLAMAIPLAVFGLGGIAIRVWWGPSVLALIAGAVALALIYSLILWVLRKRLGIVSLWTALPFIGRFAGRVSMSRSDQAAKRPSRTP